MQTDNSDDEMIIARILFYTTYDTNQDFSKIMEQNSLAENIHYVGGKRRQGGEEKKKRTARLIIRITANHSPCKAVPQEWKENLFSS